MADTKGGFQLAGRAWSFLYVREVIRISLLRKSFYGYQKRFAKEKKNNILFKKNTLKKHLYKSTYVYVLYIEILILFCKMLLIPFIT